MQVVTGIDENYLVKVKDLHTCKDLIELNQISIITVEAGVWEQW